MTRPAASKVVLQHLRYVLANAEKRSFRQAAIALDLQESTISRSICVFEDEIGFTLFERSHAGVRLTEAGKHYLRDVRAVLRYLDRATAEAQSIAHVKLAWNEIQPSEDEKVAREVGEVFRPLVRHEDHVADRRRALLGDEEVGMHFEQHAVLGNGGFDRRARPMRTAPGFWRPGR